MAVAVSEHKSRALRISVTDEQGREVAFCFLVFVYNSKGVYALLEDVFVVPDKRHEGIGTQLVRAALDCARQQGCYTLLATVNKRRPYLKAWYQRLGFVAKGDALWHDFT